MLPMAAECQHRYKRLVIDFRYGGTRSERMQIQCRDCLVATAPQTTGLAAWIAWLHDRRIELLRVA